MTRIEGRERKKFSHMFFGPFSWAGFDLALFLREKRMNWCEGGKGDAFALPTSGPHVFLAFYYTFTVYDVYIVDGASIAIDPFIHSRRVMSPSIAALSPAP